MQKEEQKEHNAESIPRPENKAIAFLSQIGLNVAIFAILAMVAIVTLNTIVRLVPFLNPFKFVEEYSGYLLVTMAFMGLAYTLRTDGHVQMTLVASKLPPRIRAGWEIVTTLGAILVISILFLHAFRFLIISVQTWEQAQTVTLTPLWIPRLMLVPGYLFLMLEMCIHLVWKIKEFRAAEQGQKTSATDTTLSYT